jgi:hypothetical protein
MLEPEARHLLLDALRPPPGYALDLAMGTTYSLDLLALMTAPVAFAMFDRQRNDGSPLDDPIAALQALRAHASRITLFCQAGQIAVPPNYRSLLVYLEGSVHPVVPPRPEAIFHPKVWYLRFRRADGDDVAYRLLCLSRNLTFDRSWDTLLCLDGRPGGRQDQPELARFATSLVAMAAPVRPVSPERAEELRELGRQFSAAEWALPLGFDRIRFWPLGDDGVERWPFEGRRDRMLVISPFVTAGALARLTKTHRGSVLISRPETFDALGGDATKHLAERLVLSPDAFAPDAEGAGSSRVEEIAESVEHHLDGLHAKTYVADAGRRARVWTGSANATDAAFHENVEFLIELEGRKDRCGVEAALGEQDKRLGLRKLVAAYDPPQPEPREPTDAELLDQRLDRARRAIGGLRFIAACAPATDGLWTLDLRGDTAVPGWDDAFAGIALAIRPVTLAQGFAASPECDASGLRVGFVVSEAAVTPYFAVELTIEQAEAHFLIVAGLVDPPAGRVEGVLTELLSNRADLIRFLLLLLGNVEDALAAFEFRRDQAEPSSAWLPGLSSEALFEPLVRAYARDPERLRDVERVVAELARNPEGEAVLPEGWDEIWGPISAALAGETSP